MKKFSILLLIMAACMFAIGMSGTAEAFHGGGVAHCDGCHSMHNSAENPIGFDRDDNPTGATANTTLMKGTDASSTCLNCHKRNGSYGVMSSDGSNKTSGGDFWWVKNDYSYPGRSGPVTDPGMNRGHNIVAADYGLVVDTVNTLAPGGDYAAAFLGCTSCHDAHGQVLDGTKGGTAPISVSGSYGAADPTDGSIHGNYRLLGDSDYEAGAVGVDDYAFDTDAPVAKANGSSGYSVDYGSGMSEWCANCHDYEGQSTMHKAGGSAPLGAAYASNYNSYIATGSWVAAGGNIDLANDGMVPFERGEADGSLLDETSTVGPVSTDNVMCLTCHRAHGSANANAGRWDFGAELIAESNALVATDLPVTAVPYYANGVAVDIVAKYGEWQRSLCNKCHAQD